VFILRKTCKCSFMVFHLCIHKSSLVEDSVIKLKHSCKNCAFCWFLLHRYITMHGSKNVIFLGGGSCRCSTCKWGTTAAFQIHSSSLFVNLLPIEATFELVTVIKQLTTHNSLQQTQFITYPLFCTYISYMAS